jgi:hypothetical protein
MRLFGKVIRHRPSTGGAENDEHMRKVKEETKLIYKSTFGYEQPRKAWGCYKCCQKFINLTQIV